VMVVAAFLLPGGRPSAEEANAGGQGRPDAPADGR